MSNPRTECGKPGIPGLIKGAGKCQYHWNVGAYGKEWADKCLKPPGPTRYAVGDKVVITDACLQRMRDSNHWCKTPGYPSDSFIANAAACKGAVGEVTHTFPPGYEVSAKFGGKGFHMKGNWIERA